MQLESIEAENFLSYSRIERKFDAGSGSLTLIEGINQDEGGSNGAGKSAVWDAIGWALFGETVRGLKADAVVHRKVGQDCRVTVTFLAGVDRYEVTRYRAHSGKDKGGAALGNRLMVHWWPDVVGGSVETDEIVEMGTIDATEKWLLDQLGVDFELLRCTMLFAQGETFNFVDETDKKQKEILSKIKRLNLQRPLETTRKRITELGEKVADADRKVIVLKSHQIEKPEDAFKPEIAEWEEKRGLRVAEASGRMEQAKADIKELESKVDDLDIDKARKGLRKLLTEWEDKRKMIREAAKPHHDALAVAQAERRKAVSLTNPTCGECGGPIDLKAAKLRVAELKDEIERLNTLTYRCIAAERKIDGEIATINEKLSSLRYRENEQEERAGRIKRAKVALIDAEVHLGNAKREKNPWLVKRDEAVAKQSQIVTKLASLEKEKAAWDDEFRYLKFWETGFSDKGLKSFVFDTICATLTRRANHYLTILTGGSVSIAFDTQTKLKTGGIREKFECLVMSDGVAVPYAAYSGGEKTRISLAVDMSLADLMTDHYGSRFNVVVFDEQDTYLDRQGRQGYLQLLKERAKTQHVFVVAHDAEFKGMFDAAWTIEKKNGFSRFIH